MCLCTKFCRALVRITISVQNVIDNLIRAIVWMLVQLTEEPPNVSGYVPVLILGSDPNMVPESAAESQPITNNEIKNPVSVDEYAKIAALMKL